MDEVPTLQSVAVIVVNWNNWKLTLDCLASLRASKGVNWHMFLVDNNSTDDSRQRLGAMGEDVTVIWSPINTGWTGGNNQGLRAAFAAGFDRVFILNNDAQVKPDTIANLCAEADKQFPPPILGPVQLDETGALDFVGSALNQRTGMPAELKAHELDFVNLPDVYETAYIRGAGIFACRDHFKAVGFFDDDFYLNYDESDWCFRAREQGFTVAMFKGAEIVHIGSASIGGGGSPLAAYFIVRNGLLFAELHCSKWQRFLAALDTLKWSCRLSDRPSRWYRLISLTFGLEPAGRAARRGFKDYAARRFGNCPEIIRTLNRRASARLTST